MSIHKITSRYAKSIIELGTEKGVLDEIIKNASFFKEVAKNREFANLLKNPVFKPEIKLRVFSELFKKNVNPIFYRFLELVIRKNREPLLPEIMNDILVQYKSMQKITDLTLITAVEVPQEFIEKLEKVLKEGSIIEENVEIHPIVDKEILGGFIIKVDDKLIDSSVRTKLKNIEKDILEKKYIRVI